jgi:arogenate dehydrogenase (NADP+)
VGAALLQAADDGGGEIGAGADLVRALASSGFADTTRVGGGNPELGMLMARANRAALLEALGHYRQSLASLEAMVAGEEWSALRQSLERSQALRPDFL